ncbi:hypothetical protein BD770DRAFT_386365 [Pilaira anomala]|nr:hypothetical protein BD770DRAFT_386365 [Pilaira anomala]
MLRSPKFVWVTCFATLILTTFFVIYTSTQSMSVQLRLSITPAAPKPATIASSKEEKFVTFLPHSGLHNQRIGLINAMILAKSLDRTLLLPEINIGNAIWWKPSQLAEFRLAECPSIKQRNNPKCHDFTKYVPVTVESIFDLSAAHSAGIRTIQRSSMSPDYFKDVYRAQEEDIYRIEDNDRYSYRIYDSKDNDESIRTFRYRIDMDDLRERDEKFIVFGSLHYTLRLAMQDPKLVWLVNYLREETSISHPLVIKQALSVLPLLGGPDKFIGVHLRQGDGFFKKLMDETVETLRATLERSALEPDLVVEEQQLITVPTITRPLTIEEEDKLIALKLIDEANPIDKSFLLNKCVQWQSEENHPRLRLIFMATDTRQPRTTLKELYDEFPCIFTLSDFPDIIESTLTMGPMLTGNKEIDEEFIQLGSRISPLLLPMIDAEIASHGSRFIGTRKSTFSQYINHRYNRFRTMYHPSTPSSLL